MTCAGVTASSSNTLLVPEYAGEPGHLRVRHVVHDHGAACDRAAGHVVITVTVSDGALTASDAFVLTVTAGVAPPTISDIGPQATTEDMPTGAMAFTVGDPDTALAAWW